MEMAGSRPPKRPREHNKYSSKMDTRRGGKGGEAGRERPGDGRLKKRSRVLGRAGVKWRKWPRTGNSGNRWLRRSDEKKKAAAK